MTGGKGTGIPLPEGMGDPATGPSAGALLPLPAVEAGDPGPQDRRPEVEPGAPGAPRVAVRPRGDL
jgi:hypothetical protein